MRAFDFIMAAAVAVIIGFGIWAVSKGWGCDTEEGYYNRNNKKKDHGEFY